MKEGCVELKLAGDSLNGTTPVFGVRLWVAEGLERPDFEMEAREPEHCKYGVFCEKPASVRLFWARPVQSVLQQVQANTAKDERPHGQPQKRNPSPETPAMFHAGGQVETAPSAQIQ